MKYQGGGVGDERKEEYPPEAVNAEQLNATQLDKLVWRYHERGQRDKLMETLLLLGSNFPESDEARIVFKSFYSTNYLSKDERKKLHPLITRYYNDLAEENKAELEERATMRDVMVGTTTTSKKE
jgi:hypothetical protein